jgi:Uma2 family endonuclease
MRAAGGGLAPADPIRYIESMLALPLTEHDDRASEDKIVLLRGATWADYQRHLEMRGDRSAPRLAYLEGVLEIMGPSLTHETLKSLIGRLIEVWCLERGVEFKTCGSWTLEKKEENRGVEPDECYVFGDKSDPERPDLAGGLDKLNIYSKLNVREVWFWRRGRITVHVLRGETYSEVPQSEILADIDLVRLVSFLDRPTTSQAMREYRASLQRAPE